MTRTTIAEAEVVPLVRVTSVTTSWNIYCVPRVVPAFDAGAHPIWRRDTCDWCLGQWINLPSGTGGAGCLPNLARYRAGESSAVWAELVALGSAVRSPAYFDDAYGVAIETIHRVRHNVEAVHERLRQVGHEFWVPDHVHVAPSADAPAMLAEIEHLRGPIPLSLQAFYEVVGSVAFRQSPRQLVHWQHEQRASVSELSVLGEEDPLVVAPVEELLRAVQAHASTQAKRVEFILAPDEFHKADYSGGENYHLWLPNPDADFRIEGMYEINEYFVEYLRATFASGGFRRRVEPMADDESRAQKVVPRLQLIDVLARDLTTV